MKLHGFINIRMPKYTKIHRAFCTYLSLCTSVPKGNVKSLQSDLEMFKTHFFMDFNTFLRHWITWKGSITPPHLCLGRERDREKSWNKQANMHYHLAVLPWNTLRSLSSGLYLSSEPKNLLGSYIPSYTSTILLPPHPEAGNTSTRLKTICKYDSFPN